MTSAPENNLSGRNNPSGSAPIFDQFDPREADLEVVNDLPEDVPELRAEIHPDDSWPAQVKREHDNGHHEHCPHPKHSKKEDKFKKGHDKASEILDQMKLNVDTIGGVIHNGNKKSHMHGASLVTLLSQGVLAPVFLVTGFGIHFTNKYMKERYDKKMQESIDALKTCANPEATKEDKQKAYDTLVLDGVRAVKNIEHFEGEKEKIVMGIVKSSISFGLDLACEFLGPVKAAKSFVENGIDAVIEHHEKKKVKPSESLMGALCLMRDGMEGIHKPHSRPSMIKRFGHAVWEFFHPIHTDQHDGSEPRKKVAPAHDQAA